jgi:hypothetical protein
MQKGKNTHTSESQLKVVTIDTDRGRIEHEIDRHVKSIRSLIERLRPAERQKYFDGLLTHLISDNTENTTEKVIHPQPRLVHSDYSNLSYDDLQLIRELSVKMEELYRTMEYDPS